MGGTGGGLVWVAGSGSWWLWSQNMTMAIATASPRSIHIIAKRWLGIWSLEGEPGGRQLNAESAHSLAALASGRACPARAQQCIQTRGGRRKTSRPKTAVPYVRCDLELF